MQQLELLKKENSYKFSEAENDYCFDIDNEFSSEDDISEAYRVKYLMIEETKPPLKVSSEASVLSFDDLLSRDI